MNLGEISKIQHELDDSNLDGIVLLGDSEHHLKDPFFQNIISSKDITAALIVTRDNVAFIIHEIEADNVVDEIEKIEEFPGESIVSGKSWAMWHTETIFKKLKSLWVKNVWLNYSENFSRLDYVSAGTLMKWISAAKKFHPELNIDSAGDIIFNIASIRNARELAALEYSQKVAHEIVLETFKQIKLWMSELEALSLLQNIYRKKINKLVWEGVIAKWELSWEEELCPIVITWKNWEKWGHAEPWDDIIEAGNTLYFDFWVKLSFWDGITMSSDIQRTAYILKDCEDSAPKEIMEMFDLMQMSIHSSLPKIIPWMTWIEADAIIREHIINFWKRKLLSNPWNNALQKISEIWYNHGTWHAIWEHAHDIWTSLSSSNENLKAKKILKEWMTITIEPRIAITNWVSIEEMVVVTKNWCKIIWEMQSELICIRW